MLRCGACGNGTASESVFPPTPVLIRVMDARMHDRPAALSVGLRVNSKPFGDERLNENRRAICKMRWVVCLRNLKGVQRIKPFESDRQENQRLSNHSDIWMGGGRNRPRPITCKEG